MNEGRHSSVSYHLYSEDINCHARTQIAFHAKSADSTRFCETCVLVRFVAFGKDRLNCSAVGRCIRWEHQVGCLDQPSINSRRCESRDRQDQCNRANKGHAWRTIVSQRTKWWSMVLPDSWAEAILWIMPICFRKDLRTVRIIERTQGNG
jgi:hypothetical protein